MQIVIDIPEQIYLNAKTDMLCGTDVIVNAIKNGTPLPKGHGELIDRDEIEYLKAIHDAKYGYITWSDASKRIKYSAPTIIKPYKAESEETDADSN